MSEEVVRQLQDQLSRQVREQPDRNAQRRARRDAVRGRDDGIRFERLDGFDERPRRRERNDTRDGSVIFRAAAEGYSAFRRWFNAEPDQVDVGREDWHVMLRDVRPLGSSGLATTPEESLLGVTVRLVDGRGVRFLALEEVRT